MFMTEKKLLKQNYEKCNTLGFNMEVHMFSHFICKSGVTWSKSWEKFMDYKLMP